MKTLRFLDEILGKRIIFDHGEGKVHILYHKIQKMEGQWPKVSKGTMTLSLGGGKKLHWTFIIW